MDADSSTGKSEEIEKVVALNSGGLDSVTMLHGLKEASANINASLDVYTLFFDYGQPAVCEEQKCAKAVAKKLGYHYREVVIPRFSWANGTLGETNSYIEMRNLVFLSYALSYAESIRAGSIFAGIRANYSPFKDCSQQFVALFDALSKVTCDIILQCPLISVSDDEVFELAQHHGIKEDDYITCLTPVNGKRCGKCNDCILETARYIRKELGEL